MLRPFYSVVWQIGFIFSFSMIDTIGFIRASNGYLPCNGIENRSRPGTGLMWSVSELLGENSRNSRYKYVYRYMIYAYIDSYAFLDY